MLCCILCNNMHLASCIVGKGLSIPVLGRREEKAQKEASGAESKFLLHGRQMPRMLQDHHSIQPCPDGGAMCWMRNCLVPANRRQSQAHGR
ncbi:hypothetical protein lerEdw1_008597 [Lerista edwardsae]|nr:hypothetical protein lerEdw1_008597 [Lerista edwardsae]